MKGQKLTQKIKDEVLRLYHGDVPKPEIEAKTSISRVSVFRILRQAIAQEKRLTRMWFDNGVSPDDIANKLNIPLRIVSRYLPEYKWTKPRKTSRRLGVRKNKAEKAPAQEVKAIQLHTEPRKLPEKIYESKPAIKKGTREVEVWPGMRVMAPINEPKESVISRYKQRFGRI